MTNAELDKNVTEIWALLRENSTQLAENRRQLELLREQSRETEQLLRKESLETERRFQETDRQMRETDKKIEETNRQMRETDKKFDRQIEETDRQMRETDKKIEETNRQMRETDKKIEETNRQMRETDKKFDKLQGLFGMQWGRLVEALIKADVVRLFQHRGVDINILNSRMERHRNGETMEIDLMLLNGHELVVVEVKSRFTQAEGFEFLDDLQNFLRFFPEYEPFKIYAAIAALDIPYEVGRWAYRQGLFVLAVTGENMVEIKNDAQFQPRDFSMPR